MCQFKTMKEAFQIARPRTLLSNNGSSSRVCRFLLNWPATWLIDSSSLANFQWGNLIENTQYIDSWKTNCDDSIILWYWNKLESRDCFSGGLWSRLKQGLGVTWSSCGLSISAIGALSSSLIPYIKRSSSWIGNRWRFTSVSSAHGTPLEATLKLVFHLGMPQPMTGLATSNGGALSSSLNLAVVSWPSPWSSRGLQVSSRGIEDPWCNFRACRPGNS